MTFPLTLRSSPKASVSKGEAPNLGLMVLPARRSSAPHHEGGSSALIGPEFHALNMGPMSVIVCWQSLRLP